MQLATPPATALQRAAHSLRWFWRSLGVLLCVVLGAAWAAPALAQTFSEPQTLHVTVGKSEAFHLPDGVTKIVVAQPETAKVDQAGPGSLYVMGREVGATNLLIYADDPDAPQVLNVEVGYDAAQLESDLHAALPDEKIQVQTLSGGLLLRGDVSNPLAEVTALRLAERAAPDGVVSLLNVRPSQVLIEVQLVETTSETLRDLGLNLDVAGSGFAVASGNGLVGAEAAQSIATLGGRFAGLSLNGALAALERHGEARMLAQPRLLALSGEKASFQAGGEFPFPVPGARGDITVEFRPYGTALAFLPTVQTNGLIRLVLESEVSSLDPRNSLRIAGITVPALSTRRVASTVELRDGQSLIVGGLYGERTDNHLRQSPGLGDLPLVGGLFRADLRRTQRTELAMIVTVHLVQGSDATVLVPTSEVVAAEPAHAVEPPARARGLLRGWIAASPLATKVAARVESLARAGLALPNRAWVFAKALSRRVVGQTPKALATI